MLGPAFQPPEVPKANKAPALITDEVLKELQAKEAANKGRSDAKERVNSLYWVRCSPNIFSANGRTLEGVAVTDPTYSRAFASRVPDKLKCKGDNQSRIAFESQQIADELPLEQFTPNTRITVHEGGLRLQSSGKVIGSSFVKVASKAVNVLIDGKIIPGIETELYVIFDRIAGDAEGRVMLIGWLKGS